MSGPVEATANAAQAAQSVEAPRWRDRPWGRIIVRLLRSKVGVAGLIVIASFLCIGFLAPLLAPYDPDTGDLMIALEGPSQSHVFGVDQFGRDILSRIIFGARTSLGFGTVVVSMAAIVGVSIGLAAGYFGGWLDRIVMWMVDVLMTFPSILVALTIAATLGTGLSRTMLAIGITMVPRFVRLTRATAMQARSRDFVQAAEAMGQRRGSIMFRHVLPNILAPLIVQGSLLMAEAVLVVAGLGFLGLGVQPPLAEWGQMLAEGRAYIRVAPHIALFPGLSIMLMVLGFNLLGDGLRDAMDVQLR